MPLESRTSWSYFPLVRQAILAVLSRTYCGTRWRTCSSGVHLADSQYRVGLTKGLRWRSTESDSSGIRPSCCINSSQVPALILKNSIVYFLAGRTIKSAPMHWQDPWFRTFYNDPVQRQVAKSCCAYGGARVSKLPSKT